MEVKECATEAIIGRFFNVTMRNGYQYMSWIFKGIGRRGFSEKIYQPTASDVKKGTHGLNL